MIASATPRDRSDIHALLEQVHLPIDGVDAHLPTMLVARADGRVVGTAALELYVDGACSGPLRSTRVGKASGSGIN